MRSTSRLTRSELAPALLALGTLASNACSLNRFAVNKLGDALSSSSSSTFASDDDLDLTAAAVPFSLKLIESLLESSSQHRGLLLAATTGFTQYAYAFVQQEADSLEQENMIRANYLRARARRLYLRARSYGLRGLETRHANFGAQLRADPHAAVSVADGADVPLLYWTAAAWGAAISLSKDDPDLVADVRSVEALIDRALELDEQFDVGAIHTFLVSYEMSRQGAQGDPVKRARAHFERAVELSGGKQASPFVAFAESVDVPTQNQVEFDSLLARAIAIDPNTKPEWRLANIVMQRRARWLLSREAELFLSATPNHP